MSGEGGSPCCWRYIARDQPQSIRLSLRPTFSKGVATNYWEGEGSYKTGRGRGGGGGGASDVLPLRKWNGSKRFSHAEGGTTSFEVVLTRELEVLAIY